MMPLNHILRKCTAGYKLTKSQEKIYYLMYMDDIKLFAEMEKKNRNSNTHSQNIQSEHREGIWHRLEDYIQKRGERLITATKNSTDHTRTNRTTITRKQKREEKQLHGRFKWLISNISHEKTWTGLRKGNHMRETESLLIAAKNNAVRTNHTKARIDKTQQNSKCKLCGDRDETINHIISEYSKLPQKEYKTGWEKWSTGNCARNFNLTIWTNGICKTHHLSRRMTHKLLWDFDIQTDHSISARRPDLIIINKIENLLNCGLCCPGWPQNKIKRKWKKE